MKNGIARTRSAGCSTGRQGLCSEAGTTRGATAAATGPQVIMVREAGQEGQVQPEVLQGDQVREGREPTGEVRDEGDPVRLERQIGEDKKKPLIGGPSASEQRLR